jgi:hypothetical protein
MNEITCQPKLDMMHIEYMSESSTRVSFVSMVVERRQMKSNCMSQDGYIISTH